jgi:hypothetical protein
MKSARVLGAGLVSIPASGQEALQLLLDYPQMVAGVRWRITGIYVGPGAPRPVLGEVVSWDHRHVVIGGKVWRKIDDEFDPDKPLG